MIVDLLLGSDIGDAVLAQVDRSGLRRVVTCDEAIADRAAALGLPVQVGDINAMSESGDVVFSVHYPLLLGPPALARYRKAYNLHPGLLPHGRGYFPVFWAIWEGTPAGATLHEMTVDVDGGPIVAQQQVPVLEQHTGYTLFQEVRAAEWNLFVEFWPRVARGDFPPARSQPDGGTYHRKRDFFELRDHPPLDGMTARDLLRLTRALAFPGYPGPIVEFGGTRYEVALIPAGPAKGAAPRG